MQSRFNSWGTFAMWSAAYYEARVLAAVLRSPVPMTYAETGEMKASARAEYSIVSAQEQVVRSGAVGAVRHKRFSWLPHVGAPSPSTVASVQS